MEGVTGGPTSKSAAGATQGIKMGHCPSAWRSTGLCIRASYLLRPLAPIDFLDIFFGFPLYSRYTVLPGLSHHVPTYV